ncbi:MAG: hypothetical protein SPF85_06890 [Alloprevotella sp.]|nr:hypothetical protein [Alloprevotella sp.]
MNRPAPFSQTQWYDLSVFVHWKIRVDNTPPIDILYATTST